MELLGEKYFTLRHYAGHLGLVGVSKMPGGKAMLVPLIIKTRKDGK